MPRQVAHIVELSDSARPLGPGKGSLRASQASCQVLIDRLAGLLGEFEANGTAGLLLANTRTLNRRRWRDVFPPSSSRDRILGAYCRLPD